MTLKSVDIEDYIAAIHEEEFYTIFVVEDLGEVAWNVVFVEEFVGGVFIKLSDLDFRLGGIDKSGAVITWSEGWRNHREVLDILEAGLKFGERDFG